MNLPKIYRSTCKELIDKLKVADYKSNLIKIKDKEVEEKKEVTAGS